MRQKGFATILGLCLILVAALIVAGISNAEMNHAYDASSFSAEQELQNAAYTGIHRAAKMVLENPDILQKIKNPAVVNARLKAQKKFDTPPIISKHFGKITVETWGERINIQDYVVDYGGTKNYARKVGDKTVKEAYYFFSRAQVDAKNIQGNLYRRASAYILADDANKTIHYLELPMSSYEFEK